MPRVSDKKMTDDEISQLIGLVTCKMWQEDFDAMKAK